MWYSSPASELAMTWTPTSAVSPPRRAARRPCRRARGRHGRPLITDAARTLITVIYRRRACSQQVPAEMRGVSQYPVGQAITETSKILAARKHVIAPAVLRFTSTAALRAFPDADSMPARPARRAALSDPALTGTSREGLGSSSRAVPGQPAHHRQCTSTNRSRRRGYAPQIRACPAR
jgi:hypothetical protein